MANTAPGEAHEAKSSDAMSVAGGDERGQGLPPGSDDDVEASPIFNMLFLLKHECQACPGTLAPVHDRASYECNRCGATRSTVELNALIEDAINGDGDFEGDEGDSEGDVGED